MVIYSLSETEIASLVAGARDESRVLLEEIRKRIAQLSQLATSVEAGRRMVDLNFEHLASVRLRGLDDADALFQLDTSMREIDKRIEAGQKVLREQRALSYSPLEEMVSVRVFRALQSRGLDTVERLLGADWVEVTNVRNIGREAQNEILWAFHNNLIQPHESWPRVGSE